MDAADNPLHQRWQLRLEHRRRRTRWRGHQPGQLQLFVVPLRNQAFLHKPRQRHQHQPDSTGEELRLAYIQPVAQVSFTILVYQSLACISILINAHWDRLLYYIAVSGGQTEYAFNCYSFVVAVGNRPHHEFDAWLRIPGLPEVRRSRQTSEQRARRNSREVFDGDDLVEAGLESWERPVLTPAAFSIVRLRGATVCLCQQHKAVVEATEVLVTVYMLHRQESLTVKVPMPGGATTGAGRRLLFSSLADYVIIHHAGSVLLLVDCSTDAPRCGSLAFVGQGLVPCVSKGFVKMPVPASQGCQPLRPRRNTGSPISGGESEYEDALSHDEQGGMTRVASIQSSVSWQDDDDQLGTPTEGPSPVTGVGDSGDGDGDTTNSMFEKQEVSGIGAALAGALQDGSSVADNAAAAAAASESAESAKASRLQKLLETDTGLNTVEPEPEIGMRLEAESSSAAFLDLDGADPHPLHLKVVPWLDELPPDGEMASGMWELDCFVLVLDCESSAVFRLSFDPEVVIGVGSAALTGVPATSELAEFRVREDLVVKLLHFAWLHLNDSSMAEKLLLDLLHGGMLHSVCSARVLREYILSGSDAVLRRQYAPRVLVRALLERDRTSIADSSASTPATSVTYGTHGAVVATGPVTRSSQLCVTQLNSEEPTGDGKREPLDVALEVQQCEWAPFPDLERSSGTSRVEYFALPAVPMSPARPTTSAARSIRNGSRDDDVAQSPAALLRTLTSATPRPDDLSFQLDPSLAPPPTPDGTKPQQVSSSEGSPFTPYVSASSSDSSETGRNVTLNGGGGTDSGSEFEAQRKAVTNLNAGRGLKFLAAADVESERLYVGVPPIENRMNWRAACRSASARYSVAKWEQAQALYTVLRHETQQAHQTLTVAARSLDLSDAALEDEAQAERAEAVMDKLKPLLELYQTLFSAAQTFGVPLPDDFDTHHFWLAAMLLPTLEIFRMIECNVLHLTPSL